MAQPPIVYPPNTPQMAQGGNLNVTTGADGTTFVTLVDRPCRHVTIGNNTGTKIEIQQDGTGVGFPVFDQTYFTLYGLSNASQIGVRRVDQSNAQVVVNARWEA